MLLMRLIPFLGFASAAGPFFMEISTTEHVIGNDLWNITIGTRYGTKLYYKGRDLVGKGAGHYVSYEGGASVDWTSTSIYFQNSTYLDVVCSSLQGDFHWVILPDLPGAYQYFVNKALPTLGEFRTLFRLDNTTFLNGKTSVKDGTIPALDLILAGTKVQDETWQLTDGSYITKYDWSDFVHSQVYHGVYGPNCGSWIISPGKDEVNGDHLKQELLLHRETRTGDVVLLNMLHGTHFMAESNNVMAEGRTWGPWLWYLNDGSISDASARAKHEQSAFPYKWFNTTTNYHARRTVTGVLTLSDGRPAAGAAIFLGDNNSNLSTLGQGANNYYTAYAEPDGKFSIPNVRSGIYALSAWSNGGAIGNVSTVFLKNDIEVAASTQYETSSDLGHLTWKTQGREIIFQIGDLDRKTLGFAYGGAPRQHGLSDKLPANLSYSIGTPRTHGLGDQPPSNLTYTAGPPRKHGHSHKLPANLTYTIGTSRVSDWGYAQSSLGSWTVAFTTTSSAAAVLSVSLAGYSSGVSTDIAVNGHKVGNLTSGSIPNDPALYRSGTTAGEWHFFEFAVPEGTLVEGRNMLVFQVTKASRWHGVMWDSILLEWA
ncbi:putative rhamnogalacturonan lyase [Diplocarpon rosae]|nr:putative rhamnogalacturonan lyase [Diplocarpon rosae]